METKYSPSINIIRDSSKEFKYIVTPNAERIARQISNDFKKGFHSFNIIGSYGTGKSSFLKAFEEVVLGKKNYFNTLIAPTSKSSKVLKFVGEYHSLIEKFSETLGVKNKLAGNQEIFDALYQEYKKATMKDGILVILIDELGKFLEYAAKHQPEKELYFIQQLAEFVNDGDNNIVFISTLHQSFDSYVNILTEVQKREWVKVKGRLKDIPFNEPVEQLLLLASEHFKLNFKNIKQPKNGNETLVKLNQKARVFPFDSKFVEKIGQDIYPLDIFSAYVLTLSLQQYGQNERSLFTFLESTDLFGINNWERKNSEYYNLPTVFDYLYYNYYSFLSNQNKHYIQWTGIKSALERAESIIEESLPIALDIIKIIGLLNLFSSKGAKIDMYFLSTYSKLCLGIEDIQEAVEGLIKYKIIRFNKFSQSYKLIEGTDLNIEDALAKASGKVEEIVDVVSALIPYFESNYISAKSVSYLKGTPRNFEIIISEAPIQLIPKDEIDGFINIIINDSINMNNLIEISGNTEEAIVYGFFNNTTQIKNELLEIEKLEKIIEENPEDIVAKKELRDIIDGHKNLLNHYVLDGFYSEDKITWAYQGKRERIRNRKQFNQLLSRICNQVYNRTPTYLNELVNKHKIPGNIHNARKQYFEALVNHWDKPNLGFEDSKFPPEKTIYLTLIKENGIHKKPKDTFELGEPSNISSFKQVWEEGEKFLDSSKHGKRKLSDLIELLQSRPYKLKQGLIDFWVPTYLFIKRGDYALFEGDKFIPFINESILYLLTKNPEKYEIKAFELSGIRLKLFNKYREYLQLDKKEKFSNAAFIESIRPFMTFYKNLPDYCRKTNSLSKEALSLRTAIVNAQDPEKVFFEDIPQALKLSLEEISNSNEALVKFAITLNTAIEEIKGAYNELLNRMEMFIQDELVGNRVEFPSYKKNLEKRFSSIKEHKLLARHTVFIQRLNSPLNDRDSWVSSICQAVIQKPLDQIMDDDEPRLKDKLLHMIKELDNFREIQKEQKSGNEIIKIDLTTSKNGLISNFIEIPKGKAKDVEKLAEEFRNRLKNQTSISVAVLGKLLAEQLNKE